MKEDEVPDFLHRAKPIVKKIDELCIRHNISRISLAMNYVKQESTISSLVFGVDNLAQLKEDIEVFQTELDPDIIDDISKEFKNIEADIVMPSLWKR
jgi:aryl-alcohol dehydrogenase-like predicted oxidoreductase